ncbi:MAG: hypothetical protein GY754_42510 [bacterium]|nr:hypothetical protein [bacterium]
MKRTRIPIITLFAVSLALLVSCQLDVPLRVMVKARYAIERAEQVKADKYDKANLDKSLKHLYKTHDFLKAEEEKKAAEEAQKSLDAANAAITTSLPLLARDTLKEAKEIYDDADELYAKKLAPDDFAKAGALIKEAESLNEETKFWDSYLKSREAIPLAKEAVRVSKENIPRLAADIKRLEGEKAELEALESSDTAKEELDLAGEHLVTAKEELANEKLEPVFNNIDEASAKLALAKTKIDVASAQKRVEELRNDIEALKNDRGAEFAGEDLEVAASSLNEAETLLKENNHSGGVTKIADAEAAIAAAREKIKKGAEKAAEKEAAEDIMASVELQYEAIGDKDTKDKFFEDREEAADMISDGKSMIDAGAYDDSIAKAEETEKFLAALSASIDKEYAKRGIVPGKTSLSGKDGNIYVVRYRKKNTDCLWRIAKKVYKDARLWPLIYVANKDQIKDPDLILPGQKFVIPPIPKRKPLSEEPPPEKAADTIGEATDKTTDESADKTSDETGSPDEAAGDKTSDATRDESSSDASDSTAEESSGDDSDASGDKDTGEDPDAEEIIEEDTVDVDALNFPGAE